MMIAPAFGSRSRAGEFDQPRYIMASSIVGTVSAPVTAASTSRGEGGVPHSVKVALSYSLFCLTNVGLNEFNQWALKAGKFPDFHFPAFYGMWHMLFSAGAALLLMFTVARPPTGLPSFGQLMDNPALFLIALCGALNVGLNNVSLMCVALFVNQVIKACQPLPTIILEIIIAKKSFSAAVIVSVCFIVVGAVIAPYYNVSHDTTGTSTLGIVSVVVAMFATSLKPVIAMIMMAGSQSKAKLSPTLMVFYDCALSFWFMFVYWALSAERGPSLQYVANSPNRTELPWLEDKDTTPIAVGIIVASSTMAFVFNLATYYFIMYTSALASTIGSLALKIFVLCIAAIQAGVHDVISEAGIALVVVSTLAYAYFSHRDRLAKEEADALGKGVIAAPAPSENTPLKPSAR